MARPKAPEELYLIGRTNKASDLGICIHRFEPAPGLLAIGLTPLRALWVGWQLICYAVTIGCAPWLVGRGFSTIVSDFLLHVVVTPKANLQDSDRARVVLTAPLVDTDLWKLLNQAQEEEISA